MQELSAVSEPPSVKDLSRASSKAALSWASDYFTNLKNVIDDDQKFVHEQHANIVGIETIFNIYLQSSCFLLLTYLSIFFSLFF